MKKSLLKSAGLALAAVGALGFGLGTSPAGQEVLTAAQQQSQVVKGQQGKKATAKQQTQQQQTQKAKVSSIASYLPWRPGERVYGKLTMTPKQYGIYLLMTGRNKYNDRRNKHWAKAIS